MTSHHPALNSTKKKPRKKIGEREKWKRAAKKMGRSVNYTKLFAEKKRK